MAERDLVAIRFSAMRAARLASLVFAATVFRAPVCPASAISGNVAEPSDTALNNWI
jgi:hypothetical protein